jgi:hypothetical protein
VVDLGEVERAILGVSQLTNQLLPPDRPSNMRQPADQDRDYGIHGGFDSQAGGFLDPSFLRTLPATAKLFTRAVTATLRDKLHPRR